MSWMRIEQMAAEAPLPDGYRFALPQRSDIGPLVGCVKAWFPAIGVGAASCYTRADFFARKVTLAGETEKDVLVVLIKSDEELAGLFSCERDPDTLALYARLAIVAPEHRGARLGKTCVVLAEAIGRHMGMELIYAMATLKIPHVQRLCERLGWQLIGIAPGYDWELVAPGVVKRVYEALYAKVLIDDTGLLRPRAQDLTPATKAFFDLLFPQQRAERG